MAAPPYVPSFYFNTFAQGISDPYTSLSAYQAGAIDANGNFLKPESSIDPLEYLIIKLKKIFAELPMGMTKAKLGNYMSTMQLFGEEAKEFGISDSEFMGLVEANLLLHGHNDVSYIELFEDMGAAGMATAGTSPAYNTGSVSGYDPAMGTTRRTQPVLSSMDNCEMFDVCPEEMRAFKDAKAWKHVPDGETKRYLQRYQRRNPKGHMALRSMNPDTGESDIYWIKFKPLSFMEEYGFQDYNCLDEENGDPIKVMADNVISPPKEDFDKNGNPIKGAAIERMGRLILGAESERTAIKTGSKSLLRHVMDTLSKVAGKPISNNKTDSYYLNPETLEMEPKDVKSHDTSLGGRVNIKDYPQHPGLQAAMEPIRQTIRDVGIDPEKLEKVKAETRRALSNLTTQNNDRLRDIALQNLSPEDILVLRGENKSKPSRFPFLSNFLSRKKVEGLMGQSKFKYGLRTTPERAEVAIRTSPDFSTQKAQTIMAKDTQTGEITSAEMHPDTLEAILKRVSPKLKDIMRQSLEPFVRK